MGTEVVATEVPEWLSWPGEYHLEGTEVSASGPRGHLVVWHLDAGWLDGLDVGGHVVVAAAGEAGGTILLDEKLTPEQTLALHDTFRRRFGEGTGFSQVPIEGQIASGRVTLSVPGRLRLLARPRSSSFAEVWIHLPEHDLVWQGERHAVTCTEFHWSSGPTERLP